MLEKFRAIKISKCFYCLNAFLIKLKSILTKNINIISIIDANIIGVDIIQLVSCFSIFRKSVFLKY